MPQTIVMDEKALNTVMSVAAQISDEKVRNTLIASLQTASFPSAMMRLDRLNT